LVGTRLGEEFASELKKCFGGPLGCTHINTLFNELSAFVTRHRVATREHPELQIPRAPGERIASRSIFFDAFLSEGAASTILSVRLADILFAEREPSGSETLFSHDEIRLLADVELAGWRLRGVEARERCRRGPDCADTPWQQRDAALGEFAGQSLGGGMTRFCLDQLGSQAADARLLSAMLCLAPGMTQFGVTLSDGLASLSSLAAPPASSSAAAALPGGLAAMGPGPCYMLRSDGPLVETLSMGATKSTPTTPTTPTTPKDSD
jgi:hypothetical protein